MKESLLKAADRVLVAVDPLGVYSGTGRAFALNFAREIRLTDVWIKVNSILLATGYPLLQDLHNLGVKVCADLKLGDIKKTMEDHGRFLAEYRPAMVTVSPYGDWRGIVKLRSVLDGTLIVATTTLTSVSDEECLGKFGRDRFHETIRTALVARELGLDGIVVGAKELPMVALREDLSGLELIVAGITMSGHTIEYDDQNARITPREAIGLGADRIIVGRSVMQRTPETAQGVPRFISPRERVEKIILQIKEAEVEKSKGATP